MATTWGNWRWRETRPKTGDGQRQMEKMLFAMCRPAGGLITKYLQFKSRISKLIASIRVVSYNIVITLLWPMRLLYRHSVVTGLH